MIVRDRSTLAVFARAPLLAVCLALMVACAASAVSVSPPAASPRPEPTPDIVGIPGVPTACLGLGEQDCGRVAAHVATLLPAGGPAVTYLQVGPFRCPGEQACAPGLAARPEGEVVVEFPGAASAFLIKTRGGGLDAQPLDVFGVHLPPTTRPPLPAAAQPFTLGHCGLWSGIDFGGSWWEPVGFVDFGHTDAINAAGGRLVLVGPDRAMFTSNGGLIVELARRDGEKFLPLCR